MIEEKVIWQPYGFQTRGHNFKIGLDRDFAIDMINTKIPQEQKKMIKRLAKKKLWTRGYEPFLNFYKDTALAVQFSLGKEGNSPEEFGKFISIPKREGRDPLEVYPQGPIIYGSFHMASADNLEAIFRIFDLWAKSVKKYSRDFK